MARTTAAEGKEQENEEQEFSASSLENAVSCLSNGKRLAPAIVTPKFLSKVSERFEEKLNNSQIAPSKCAHAMCLSCANGYSEIVQMLYKRPKSTFNKAYTFEEPLGRAIRSWIKAKNENNLFIQSRCYDCAKYLIEVGADINVPEKYLKTKLTPAQRLRNDGSTEALRFLEELTSDASTKTPNDDLAVEDAPPTKKRRQNTKK